MVASYDTIVDVLKVIRKHVNDSTFEVILHDLLKVEGNESFKQTIRRLHRIYMESK
jgi:hypothetical protein